MRDKFYANTCKSLPDGGGMGAHWRRFVCERARAYVCDHLRWSPHASTAFSPL